MESKNNKPCDHSVCTLFYWGSYCGFFTEQELYDIVRDYILDNYYSYKEGCFDEYFYHKSRLPDFDFSNRDFVNEFRTAYRDTIIDYFDYCPDCGKRLYKYNIKQRINKKIYDEISTLPKRTKEDEKAIRAKAKELKIKINKDKENVHSNGYVYVIKLDKHYKIGISKTPESRLKEFTLLPYELETVVLEKVKDYDICEEELHAHFADKRVRGEWFLLNDMDIEYIKNYLLNKK